MSEQRGGAGGPMTTGLQGSSIVGRSAIAATALAIAMVSATPAAADDELACGQAAQALSLETGTASDALCAAGADLAALRARVDRARAEVSRRCGPDGAPREWRLRALGPEPDDLFDLLVADARARSLACRADAVRTRLERGDALAPSDLAALDAQIAAFGAPPPDGVQAIVARAAAATRSRLEEYLADPSVRADRLRSSYQRAVREAVMDMPPADLQARVRAFSDFGLTSGFDPGEVLSLHQARAILEGLPVIEALKVLGQRAADWLPPSRRDLGTAPITAFRRAAGPRFAALAGHYEALVEEAGYERLVERHQAALDAGKAAWDEVRAAIDGARPLAGDALAPLVAAAAAPIAAIPEAALRVEALRFQVAVYRAWWTEKPQAALARAFEGSLVSGHDAGSDASPGDVRIEAGSCYLLVAGHPKEPGLGYELVELVRQWVKVASLRPFNVSFLDWTRYLGFCARATTTLPAIALSDLTWALVRWPRDKIPTQVAYRLLPLVNHCDATAWEVAWTDPLPFALTTVQGVPALRTGEHEWLTIAGTSVAVQASDVQSEAMPLANVPWDREECRAPEDGELAQCLDAARTRWQAEYDTAEAAHARARTEADERATVAALEALARRQASEQAGACAAERARVDAPFEAAQARALAAAIRPASPRPGVDLRRWQRTLERGIPF